jgi:hypothetical protein
MATRYWIYREVDDGEDEQIGGPFEPEGAAQRTADLLNQEVDGESYYQDSPHNHMESSTAEEVFGPKQLL